MRKSASSTGRLNIGIPETGATTAIFVSKEGRTKMAVRPRGLSGRFICDRNKKQLRHYSPIPKLCLHRLSNGG